MKTVSAVEARKGLGMLLNRVSLRHETFVIERAGKKIAILKSYEDPGPKVSECIPGAEGKLDFRDIAGVGKELWAGVNVEEYIRGERQAWK